MASKRFLTLVLVGVLTMVVYRMLYNTLVRTNGRKTSGATMGLKNSYDMHAHDKTFTRQEFQQEFHTEVNGFEQKSEEEQQNVTKTMSGDLEPSSIPDGSPRLFSGCPDYDPSLTTVHIIPHSHDDVGWLKTVEEYFTGDKAHIQRANVTAIITTVVQELLKDKRRRFIQVETAFFWRWWKLQDEETRRNVKQLVQEKRLEFIGGGWSMNDEAVCHYSSIIDNMALGFQTLQEEFGSEVVIPKIGWQIDPFGHSKEQANLFAQMGFDGMFFARIDWRDKEQRKANRSLQMIWEGSESLGEAGSLFTAAFTGHYYEPDGFAFDIAGHDYIDKENKEEKVQQFLRLVKENKEWYRHKHIMFVFGRDFGFEDAKYNFENIDRLIDGVNELTDKTKVKVIYSTPSCYLKALNELQIQWPSKTDDFFPYQDREDGTAYWTGYFTTRASIKLMERRASGILHAARQTVAMLGYKMKRRLNVLRRAMGVLQHHDAVTGTARTLVSEDYRQRLSKGENKVLPIFQSLIGQPSINVSLCPYLNVSQCDLVHEHQESFMVTVYNPLSRTVSKFVRIPVQLLPGEGFTVKGVDEEKLDAELIAVPKQVLRLPGRKTGAQYDLLFRAADLPPLGFKQYLISRDKDSGIRAFKFEKKTKSPFSDIKVDAFYYKSWSKRDQLSGIYIFRPDGPRQPISSKEKKYRVLASQFVTETLVVLDQWVSYIIRKYKGDAHYEVQWLVGPIPTHDEDQKKTDDDEFGFGREVIMSYESVVDKVQNGETFYTDSNGRQYLKRELNKRLSFDLGKETEVVAGNYYPLTSGIYIQDKDNALTVLTDRSQGGASLQENNIEIMVHRRVLLDDWRGVTEPLDETEYGKQLIVRGTHYVKVGTAGGESAQWRRATSQEVFLKPLLIFSPGKERLKTFKGLQEDLPENVNILTLEPWGSMADDDKFLNTVLLRLEHIYDVYEHDKLSKPVDVDLQKLFRTFNVRSATEMNLGASEKLSEAQRLHWTSQSFPKSHKKVHPMNKPLKDLIISLKPMEIRTFVLQIERASSQ